MKKRCFDIACSSIGILLLLPLLVTVAAFIFLDDRRPIFFVQERIGRHRRPIQVVKFRTMRGGKVTRVGGWLRATGIDEIPQFLNVLTDQMSLVGPRPLTQYDIERIGWDSARYADRWHAFPGITGLAQLYGGHSARMSWYLDRRYLAIQSLRLDIWIVTMSFIINIFGKRRVRGWLRKRSGRTVYCDSRPASPIRKSFRINPWVTLIKP